MNCFALLQGTGGEHFGPDSDSAVRTPDGFESARREARKKTENVQRKTKVADHTKRKRRLVFH